VLHLHVRLQTSNIKLDLLLASIRIWKSCIFAADTRSKRTRSNYAFSKSTVTTNCPDYVAAKGIVLMRDPLEAKAENSDGDVNVPDANEHERVKIPGESPRFRAAVRFRSLTRLGRTGRRTT